MLPIKQYMDLFYKDNWLANIFYYLKNPIEFNKLRTSLYDITQFGNQGKRQKNI